jgi:hypothetical protein
MRCFFGNQQGLVNYLVFPGFYLALTKSKP